MRGVLEFFRSQVGKGPWKTASPMTHWLGWVMRRADPGEVVLEFRVTEPMVNGLGVAHGGALAAMLDALLGGAAATLEDEAGILSLGLYVDFLRKAPLGAVLTGTGRVVREGGTIVNVTGDIVDEEGKIVCRGTANIIKVRRKAGESSAPGVPAGGDWPGGLTA